jgi:transposase-like protein
MLDAAMYNVMLESRAAIFEAASASLTSVGGTSETPPALLQVNAGRAESPSWFLVQAAEFDPEPLTVADLRVRDVYAAPRVVQTLLDLMASAGWLEQDGRDAYALAVAGRALVQRSRQRLQTRLMLLAPPAAVNVEDLCALLSRVLAGGLAAPTPSGTRCLAHSQRRAPVRDAPAMAQVMHYFDDFNAFRDDAHMAAWRPHAVEGYAWEAFALVVRGEAQAADALFDMLADRGYRRAEYAHALTDLVERGWLKHDASSGLTFSTAAGAALHAAVERATDQFFYNPWTCLSDVKKRDSSRPASTAQSGKSSVAHAVHVDRLIAQPRRFADIGSRIRSSPWLCASICTSACRTQTWQSCWRNAASVSIHPRSSTGCSTSRHCTRGAARHHRHRVTGRWSADETYVRTAGHWCYVFRAIDDAGQVIDVYVSPTRDTAAALAFLTRAVASTGVTPHTVTTDRAPIYPPAFARVLPDIEHRTGKMVQQRIERDHEHLKGRYGCMRGFQTVQCAKVVCAGHRFMRNMRDGFYRLGLAA